jgi:Uma2 family endonuclease
MLNPPDGKLYELVRGELVEKKMAALSVWIAFRIGHLIELYLEHAASGWVSTEIAINCFPWLGKHGRRPDVAYFHFARSDGPGNDPILVAPNFAVEVLSPNDEAIDVDVKVEEYFRAGAELVWVVNPQTKTVRAQRADGQGHFYHAGESVDLAPVLPDLRLNVDDFIHGPKKR